MISIKDKIAKMIQVANGELVRHCHVVEAGICAEDNKVESRPKNRRVSSKSKGA